MNKILEVTDYEILFRISRLVDKKQFKGIDYTADDFFRYLLEEIEETKTIKVFASINQEKKSIDGFIICSMIRDLVRNIPQIFVDLAWVNPKAEKEVGQELLGRVEDFAREMKVYEMSCYSAKKESSMLKKYGFDLQYSVFVKKVSIEKEGKQNVIREEKERRDPAQDIAGAGGSGGTVKTS